MAYIPPHKRHSKDDGDDDNRPRPTQFQKNVGSSSTSKSRTISSKDSDPKLRIFHYMQCAISKWFIEADDDQIPADSIWLEPDLGNKCFLSGSLPRTRFTKNIPWVSITEKIRPDLLASFANMRTAMDLGEAGAAIKPTFVARIGQIGFCDVPDDDISRSYSSKSEFETALARPKKPLFTNLPESYMEAILGGVASMIVADFYQSKESYYVLVSDNRDPKSGIFIKCHLICGELKIQKVEKNQKRCFRADVTCLHEPFDLRLLLSIKRDLTAALKDDFEELKGLKHFVDSAILDGNVKGGLRWPMGKEHSSDGRYSVIGIQHSTVKTFKNSSLKLRLTNADVFDFYSSDGQVVNELVLDLKGINDMLIDRVVDMEPAIGILEETLKLVWNHLLSIVW